MGKKICFAVPTFPGHYLHALDFMKSFAEYQYDKQADLFFIFTTPEERDGFMPCNSIVLPKSLRIMANKGIINIKKFYALMQLKDRYEYIIVIDDECLFCKTVDLNEICTSFFERKILYGNIVENAPWDFAHIVPDCCRKFFDKETQKKLNCPIYLWFNQLPIYRTADLKEFFKMTDMGHRIHYLTYTDFDYYIYMFYLIAKRDFDIVDIGIVANRAFVEITSECCYTLVEKKDKIQHVYMSTLDAKNSLFLADVFLLCHCDRDIAKPESKNKISRLITAFVSYFRIKNTIVG